MNDFNFKLCVLPLHGQNVFFYLIWLKTVFFDFIFFFTFNSEFETVKKRSWIQVYSFIGKYYYFSKTL